MKEEVLRFLQGASLLRVCLTVVGLILILNGCGKVESAPPQQKDTVFAFLKNGEISMGVIHETEKVMFLRLYDGTQKIKDFGEVPLGEWEYQSKFPLKIIYQLEAKLENKDASQIFFSCPIINPKERGVGERPQFLAPEVKLKLRLFALDKIEGLDMLKEQGVEIKEFKELPHLLAESIASPPDALFVGLAVLKEEKSYQLRKLVEQGIPIIAEGKGEELKKVLALDPGTAYEPNDEAIIEIFGTKIRKDGSRSDFVVQRYPPQDTNSWERINQALKWIIEEKRVDHEEWKEGAEHKKDFRRSQKDNFGIISEAYAATSLGKWYRHWTFTTYSYNYIGNQVARRVEVNRLKEEIADADFYALCLFYNHTSNYKFDFPWSRGWYCTTRYARIYPGKYENSYHAYEMLNYGPPATTGQSTTGYSVGGDISVSRTPGATLSVSYSKSWSSSDIITDAWPNFSRKYGYWRETFANNLLWPWNEPVPRSRSSHKSYPAVIIKTTNPKGTSPKGVKFNVWTKTCFDWDDTFWGTGKTRWMTQSGNYHIDYSDR